MWKGYIGLNKLRFKHQTLNHSIEFVKKTTGAHTQTIESLWGRIKRSMPSTGTDPEHLMSYVRTFQWREQFTTGRGGFGTFLEAVRKLYNPHSPIDCTTIPRQLHLKCYYEKKEDDEEEGEVPREQTPKKKRKMKKKRKGIDPATLRRSNRVQTMIMNANEAAEGLLDLNPKRRKRMRTGN